MRKFLVIFGAAVAMVLGGSQADAAVVSAYSFETIVDNPIDPDGPDGFFGLGATPTQESTIGVTDGDYSLKYAIGPGGFVGVRTESVIPAALNDPPGVVRILFDLTIDEAYADSFADLGITIFGHALNAPGGAEFGHQVQFADTLSMAGLASGTYLDQVIVLDSSLGPFRPGESFNDIFGPGVNDLTVASAFQFYVSKNVSTPFTFYIDNVRLDDGTTVPSVPEPATLGLFGLGVAALALFRKRQGDR